MNDYVDLKALLAKIDDKEEVHSLVQQKFYELACVIYEGLEHQRKIYGNGHHIAQTISASAADYVNSRWAAGGSDE